MTTNFLRQETNSLKKDPRYKVFHSPDEMEDWELLAVLIGKGTKNKNVEILSREIIFKLSGLSGLIQVKPYTLMELNGLGRAKIASLLAAREIAARIRVLRIENEPEIPFDEMITRLAETLFLKSSNEKRECFYLATFSHNKIHLNTRLIARGSLTEVGVYTRDLVKIMLNDGANYAIIAHNHPNDKCKPSIDDLQLYSYLKELILPLELELMDQWIFGIDGIYSCKQNKKINFNAEWNTSQNKNHSNSR